MRNITAQHFGYSAVSALRHDVKGLTVADSQCLDPISDTSGSRRYSFNLEDGECLLFVNHYARKGRHNVVLSYQVPGSNAFVHCTADTVNCDPDWLAAMNSISGLPADAKFDYRVGNRYTACTLDFSLAPRRHRRRSLAHGEPARHQRCRIG